MTPPTPPPTPSEDDWLAHLLQEEPAYIDDAGFTSQVIARLPDPTRALRQRRIILGFAVLFALVTGIFTLPKNLDLAQWLHWIPVSVSISQSFVLIALASFAALFICSSLIFIIREK